jgi:hypothetical protein
MIPDAVRQFILLASGRSVVVNGLWVAGIIVFQMALAGPALSGNSDQDMIHLAPEAIENSLDENSSSLSRLSFSKEFDGCVRAYFEGDKKRGEQFWKKLLIGAKGCSSVHPMVKNLHGHIVMISRDERMPKCHGLCLYLSLLTATQQAMPHHRFVADVLDFIGSHYEDYHDYKSAIPYRSQQVEIMTRRLGTKNEETQDVIQNLAYDQYLNHDYKAAQKLIDASLTACRTYKLKNKYVVEGLKLRKMIERATHK